MDLSAAILHYCKYQERCHSEVRNKLYQLGLNKNEVENHISQLIETGVLNEERFARAFARGKFRMKGWGKEKIKQQLKLRKISDYCIRKALTEIGVDDYRDSLAKLARRKLQDLKGDKNEFSVKGKVYRYLLQKGYGKEEVINVINECMNKK